MTGRDDFSRAVKNAVALRAGHRCSFPECAQPTVGPSDEAPDAITMIGEAAHIHAAAGGSGARRYLASMPSEQRSDIDNAIWLCANHARLIDRDEATYTPDRLRAMKQAHEAKCAAELRHGAGGAPSNADLIALGPDLICVGELLGGREGEWQLSVRHFVEGDLNTLISYCDDFRRMDDYDRYVCIGMLGDGRVLRSTPSWLRRDGGYIVTCPVFPSFPRIAAGKLGTDLALSDTNDLVIKNGDMAMVSGVEALPQKIKITLSMQRGESPFYKKFGSRLATYYAVLRGSVWFEQLIKLEVIRLAAIPYPDPVLDKRDTPFQCVERVFKVDVLSNTATDGWLPIRVHLEVKELGRWQRQLSVCVRAPEPRPTLEEMLRGSLA